MGTTSDTWLDKAIGADAAECAATGAKKVVNNIKVSEAAKETASANLEQGRRRAQVKRSDTTPRTAKRSS